MPCVHIHDYNGLSNPTFGVNALLTVEKKPVKWSLMYKGRIRLVDLEKAELLVLKYG